MCTCPECISINEAQFSGNMCIQDKMSGSRYFEEGQGQNEKDEFRIRYKLGDAECCYLIYRYIKISVKTEFMSNYVHFTIKIDYGSYIVKS